jgi:hypothetical protein
VLRARITSLEPALPIVYAKTLSTSTSSPALLRSGEHLKSGTEARQEFLDTLQGRSAFLLFTRVGFRSYAPGNDARVPVKIPPFLWLTVGVEGALTQARAWTGSFAVGATWFPQQHFGWSAQARISRLISGTMASLTHPDLYLFIGGSVISVQGQTALVFSNEIPNLANLAEIAKGAEPHTTFGAVQLGLELRVKNRFGIGLFMEWMPGLGEAPALGHYLDLGLIKFDAVGAEVSFCF